MKKIPEVGMYVFVWALLVIVGNLIPTAAIWFFTSFTFLSVLTFLVCIELAGFTIGAIIYGATQLVKKNGDA